MTIRIASPKDYPRLRELWEAVFPEDSSNYLDFYFKHVADHNTMILAQDKGHIAAMLHMNPYYVNEHGKPIKTYYIVAVATEPLYRRRGIMAAMIEKAKDIAQREGIKVLVLMPADERYYTPYNFYFASHQYNTTIISDLYPIDEQRKEGLRIERLSMDTFVELMTSKAYRASRTMEAVPSEAYARQLFREVESESGHIYFVNGAIALMYNQATCDVRKIYLSDEQCKQEGYQQVADGLVHLAAGKKLILHEINECPIAECFPYNRKNTYDYRPYMMVCNLDTCEPMLKEVYFDEIV